MIHTFSKASIPELQRDIAQIRYELRTELHKLQRKIDWSAGDAPAAIGARVFTGRDNTPGQDGAGFIDIATSREYHEDYYDGTSNRIIPVKLGVYAVSFWFKAGVQIESDGLAHPTGQRAKQTFEVVCNNCDALNTWGQAVAYVGAEHDDVTTNKPGIFQSLDCPTSVHAFAVHVGNQDPWIALKGSNDVTGRSTTPFGNMRSRAVYLGNYTDMTSTWTP